MTSPASGAVLSNIYQNGSTDVSVTGTGTDLNLSNWAVDFGSGPSPSSWTSIGTGTTPVSAAQFASWATLGLTYGTYTLRLQVWDLAGNRSFVSRTETVGNFLVSGGSQTLYLAGAGTVSFTSAVPFTITETVVVVNAQSQTIATLFNGQRNAGTYTDSWNGHDSSNALVPDGAYSVIATAVSGVSSLTVNPGPAPVSDSTQFVAYFFSGWSTAEFFPFNNNPFIGTYTFTNGTPPRPGRVWVLFTPNQQSVYFNNAAHISWCNWPGNFCAPAGDYQWPGTHTFSWLGIDPSGNLRSDITAIVVMITGETAGGNVVQVYGTQPAVTNFAISPTYYRPGSGTLQIALNAATYQGRTVSATAQFERLGVAGALQTVTLTGQSSGPLSLSWDGRSSTGLLVAAGQYLVTVTVTDSAGAQTVQQGLMTINY
jgi:flagellar hook assembly protein FlgD